MWAAGENHAEVVSLLAARGADLNAALEGARVPEGQSRRGDDGDDGAAARRVDGADVRGPAGRRATACARWPRRAPISTRVDPDGTTALDIAIINAHYDVAALLDREGRQPEHRRRAQA